MASGIVIKGLQQADHTLTSVFKCQVIHSTSLVRLSLVDIHPQQPGTTTGISCMKSSESLAIKGLQPIEQKMIGSRALATYLHTETVRASVHKL